MSDQTLEQRVAVLEKEIRELKSHNKNGLGQKPWLRIQGMFGGDELMKEIFEEARKIRENDRRRARNRYTKNASTRRARK
jgi:hypothetical protein